MLVTALVCCCSHLSVARRQENFFFESPASCKKPCCWMLWQPVVFYNQKPSGGVHRLTTYLLLEWISIRGFRGGLDHAFSLDHSRQGLPTSNFLRLGGQLSPSQTRIGMESMKLSCASKTSYSPLMPTFLGVLTRCSELRHMLRTDVAVL